MSIKDKIRKKIRFTFIYKYYSMGYIFLKDIKAIYYINKFKKIPIVNNKVLFSSYNGQKFDGEPKEICDTLVRNFNIEPVWVLPENLKSQCPYKSVVQNSKEHMYELMTSGIWIDNCRKKFWVKKKTQQLYIQTWHGPVCIKFVEKDAEETLPPFYVESAIRD